MRQSAGNKLDSAPLEVLQDRVLHIAVESRQWLRAAEENLHFTAEPGKDAGELHANVACAEDGDAPWHGGQVEDLIGSQRRRQTLDGAGHRAAASGDQQFV